MTNGNFIPFVVGLSSFVFYLLSFAIPIKLQHMEKHPSIFNNVIGPVMRGPSSSHTAASVRIGLLARRLLGEEPAEAVFRFDTNGSVASTYRGQGSAMGLAGGLLGMSINHPGLMRSEETAAKKGLRIEYMTDDYGADHPNTYDTTVKGRSGKEISFTALSTGGGIIRLTKLNGKAVDDDLDYINPLMPVQIVRKPVLPFNNIDELTTLLNENGGTLSDHALKYESALGNIPEQKVFELSMEHLDIIKASIRNGLAGTSYPDRVLHHQSHLVYRKPQKGQLIPSDFTNDIIASVSAIMETKSSMGVIVAAPTAGACGTIGGVLNPVAIMTDKKEKEVAKALLAAGMLGVFIAQEGGFAAEEGGCQYECGSASGMAAAALVELMGGDGIMSLNAASMAMQNTIGMICDPVADRVEVPCLGKNIMAALNALAATNMTIAGYDHVIPLKEVIETMHDVGNAMDSRYRCTCKGGLSATKTAEKIYREINKL